MQYNVAILLAVALAASQVNAGLPEGATQPIDAAKAAAPAQLADIPAKLAAAPSKLASAPSKLSGLVPEQMKNAPGKFADAAKAVAPSQLTDAPSELAKAPSKLADAPAELASAPSKLSSLLPEQVTSEPGKLADAAAFYGESAKSAAKAGMDAVTGAPAYVASMPEKVGNVVDATKNLASAAKPELPTAQDLCQTDDDGDRVGFCNGLAPSVESDGEKETLLRRQDFLDALCEHDGATEVGFCHGLIPDAKLGNLDATKGKRADQDLLGLANTYAPDVTKAVTSLLQPCDQADDAQQKVPGLEGLCKTLVPDAKEQAVAATNGGGLVIKRQVDYGVKKGLEGSAKGFKASEDQVVGTIEHPPTPEQLLQTVGTTVLGTALKSLPNRRRQLGLEMLLPCAHGEGKDLKGEAGFCNSLIPSAHERDVMSVVRRSIAAKMHSRFVKRTQRF